jgi:hypothetical protein
MSGQLVHVAPLDRDYKKNTCHTKRLHSKNLHERSGKMMAENLFIMLGVCTLWMYTFAVILRILERSRLKTRGKSKGIRITRE